MSFEAIILILMILCILILCTAFSDQTNFGFKDIAQRRFYKQKCKKTGKKHDVYLDKDILYLRCKNCSDYETYS